MNAENEEALASFADVVSERDREAPLTPAELIERMQGCVAILSLNGTSTGEITADILKAVGTIKVICIAHWWEQLVDAAKGAGVELTEGSNSNTISVAEWTLSAALMGLRKLHRFDAALKSGPPWVEPRPQVNLLCDSTVGIVGLGRIGWYVAQYFQALGAKVLAYDKYWTPDRAKELGVELVSLDELMGASDVVSLHLPVTPETTGLIGAREFSLIKDGAVLVNSARAALYDERALVAELQKKRFTACLDVFAEEPLPAGHPFRSMDNVVITPHIAGDNDAMFLRCGREAIETLKEYFEGKPLRNMRYSFPG
jgi:phosphoglycerate dehydrogenase-like enzyme